MTVIRIATEGSNSGKICGDPAELDVGGVLFVAGFLGEEEGGVGAIAIDSWFHGFIVHRSHALRGNAVGTLCVQYEWRRRGASGDCVAHAERGNDGTHSTTQTSVDSSQISLYERNFMGLAFLRNFFNSRNSHSKE